MRGSLVLGLALFTVAVAGGEETSVAQVIATCERALATGYDDLDAAACDWFVRPCGVCGITAIPTWCPPPGIAGRTLAETLVAELRRAADPTAAAKPRIDAFLRARYPCPAADAEAPAELPRAGSRPTLQR